MNDDLNQALAPREAACALLEAALSRRAGIDEAAAAPAFQRLEGRDRAFARALTLAALRYLGVIDRALAPRLKKEPPPRVRAILQIGVAQAFFLDVPEFAAVATSVELAGSRAATRPFKGLVNAVLRGLLRDGPPAVDPQALAPDWLYARWVGAYGKDTADAIAAQIAAEPATDLSVKLGVDAAALAVELEGEVLAGGSIRTARRGDIAGWPGFEEGGWWVQDAAAAIPARLLNVRAGETVLDMCAAPGGKTLQLAAAGAQVVALDRSAARLTRVAENLARMSLSAEIVAADAGEWDDGRRFDAVLLDAPCSATGTFRRHPDVLWASRPGDIAKLAGVQARLLDAAVDKLKPGGRLVFCTCSLEAEEGEAQIRNVLARRPDLRLEPITAGEGGAPTASLTSDGALRLLPHQMAGGMDGFFTARLRRAG